MQIDSENLIIVLNLGRKDVYLVSMHVGPLSFLIAQMHLVLASCPCLAIAANTSRLEKLVHQQIKIVLDI